MQNAPTHHPLMDRSPSRLTPKIRIPTTQAAVFSLLFSWSVVLQKKSSSEGKRTSSMNHFCHGQILGHKRFEAPSAPAGGQSNPINPPSIFSFFQCFLVFLKPQSQAEKQNKKIDDPEPMETIPHRIIRPTDQPKKTESGMSHSFPIHFSLHLFTGVVGGKAPTRPPHTIENDQGCKTNGSNQRFRFLFFMGSPLSSPAHRHH